MSWKAEAALMIKKLGAKRKIRLHPVSLQTYRSVTPYTPNRPES
jgi:hypothetical protein